MALPVFYPIFGGGPLRFLGYQKGLRARGVDVRVLTGTPRAKDELHQPGQSPSDTEARGRAWSAAKVGTMLPVEFVEGTPVHRVRLPARTGVLRTNAYFRALLDLCRDPETRPDVIQLHSFERVESLYWIWRLRRLGIPIVYVVQIARKPSQGSRLVGLSRALLQHVFYNAFDGVVTSSETIMASQRAIGIRTPIEVIANGVDLKRFDRRDRDVALRLRASVGLRGAGPVMMSVGAVGARKGTDLVVEAWSRMLAAHPDLELVLVGPTMGLEGDRPTGFAGELRERIRASGRADQVHVLGVRDDVADLYSLADVMVLPTDREGGTPNVVLESMACSCPVVLTPFLGQSIRIGRPGVEFEHADRTAAGVALAAQQVLEDPERRRELIDRGREWVVRTLDQEEALDRFDRVYRSLERRGPRRDRSVADTIVGPVFDSESTAGPSARDHRDSDAVF